MENNYDNTPKENGAANQTAGGLNTGGQNMDSAFGQSNDSAADAGTGRQYTDPNAGQQPQNYQQYQYTSQNAYNQQSAYNYNQQNNGQYGGQNQQNGYDYSQQSYNYQDNYSYNTGNNGNYNQYGQDTSPMSMGDWILTILASMIPCVGIVLYFVWAFSKTTNINRRNFCRAELIIMGIVLVIYLIFVVLFGSMIFSSGLYY